MRYQINVNDKWRGDSYATKAEASAIAEGLRRQNPTQNIAVQPKDDEAKRKESGAPGAKAAPTAAQASYDFAPKDDEAPRFETNPKVDAKKK